MPGDAVNCVQLEVQHVTAQVHPSPEDQVKIVPFYGSFLPYVINAAITLSGANVSSPVDSFFRSNSA